MCDDFFIPECEKQNGVMMVTLIHCAADFMMMMMMMMVPVWPISSHFVCAELELGPLEEAASDLILSILITLERNERHGYMIIEL